MADRSDTGTQTEDSWAGAFAFTTDGSPSTGIRLTQVGDKVFTLSTTLTYVGASTGLEATFPAGSEGDTNLRTLTPDQLPETDLASVPGPVRWFMNSYGVHTPAALIHDRLIPTDDAIPGMTDAYADRYFRFMLEALGVRWLKRWLMWAAVAFRTRHVTSTLSVYVWVALALLGMVGFVIGLATGALWLVAVAVLAPLPIALLWGKQWGAGLVASVCIPFIGPPAIVAVAGYCVYLALEWVSKLVLNRD